MKKIIIIQGTILFTIIAIAMASIKQSHGQNSQNSSYPSASVSVTGGKTGPSGSKPGSGNLNKGTKGVKGSSADKTVTGPSGNLHLQEPESNPEGTPGNNGHPYQNSPPH